MSKGMDFRKKALKGIKMPFFEFLIGIVFLIQMNGYSFRKVF